MNNDQVTIKQGRINKKICPKCKNKNTRRASKLGYYAGSMFCLDCAIYYNQYVREIKNES